MCVWLLAKVIAAAPAEHFGRGAQLHVNFQTNNGLIRCRWCIVPHRSGFQLLHSVTCSYCFATLRTRSSIKWGPMTCILIGRSSLEKPQQILIPGSPAMLEGSSSASETSPNIGWFLLDPTGNAVLRVNQLDSLDSVSEALEFLHRRLNRSDNLWVNPFEVVVRNADGYVLTFLFEKFPVWLCWERR